MPFQPGQSGNPAGRPKGIVDRRQQFRMVLESQAEELVLEAVRRALQGSDGLLGLLVGRLISPVKAQGFAVEADTPQEIRFRWLDSKDSATGGEKNTLCINLEGSAPKGR